MDTLTILALVKTGGKLYFLYEMAMSPQIVICYGIYSYFVGK